METYYNPFRNSIFDTNNQNSSSVMSDTTTTSQDHAARLERDPSLQRFTATGRPMPHPKVSAAGRAMSAFDTDHSWGQTAPNLLPIRFTDASVISIPVMPPEQVASADAAAAAAAAAAVVVVVASWDSSSTLGPITDEKAMKKQQHQQHGGFSSFFRRKSHKVDELEFVMKDVTRGDYLKYYAKDEEGRYIGTEEPAQDCILKHDADRLKYRARLQFSNS